MAMSSNPGEIIHFKMYVVFPKDGNSWFWDRDPRLKIDGVKFQLRKLIYFQGCDFQKVMKNF